MAVTAYDDACRFVELHPWATTEFDNPVEILRDLQKEHTELIEELDEATHQLEHIKANPSEALVNASAQIDELVAFIRKLHDEQKISDLEWERAKLIGKRVPPHRAER